MSKRNNQPIDEDDDDEIHEEYLQNTQDKAERLKIRLQYRNILEDLRENKHECVNPASTHLSEALEAANTLNKNVKTPREGALDSTTILAISSLALQQAGHLNTDFVKFEPIEFAEKLVSFIRRENNAPSDTDSPISPDGWKNLGAAGQKLFSKNPPFHFMAGSFDRDAKARPQKIKDKHQKEKDNVIDKETIPKKMDSFDDSGGKNEATTAEVERVLDILQRLYRQTNELPICFFEFVLNPHSFGQTIENIFYTSFLVKDGLAKVSLDEDNLPIIEPLENSEDGTGQQKSKNRQTIISISPAEWRELVQVYQIEDPLIPTRDQADSRQSSKKAKMDSKSQSRGKSKK